MFSRMSTIFKAKVNSALDKAEDPGQTLDYSYEKQLEMLQQVKRGIVEVTTAKKRLELQSAQTKQDMDRMDGQARQALTAGREDLARTVLQRKATAQQQLNDLDTQIQGLDAQEQKLADAEAKLSAKVEAFRTQKEVIKAQFSAASAQVRIGEAVTGISEEMTDVGMAVDRAKNRTEQMQARAGAIDDLVSQGVLADVTDTTGGNDVDRQLAQISAQQDVDAQLAKMKAELGPAAESKQLGAGQQPSS
jgi:phage shock protein A